MLDHLLINEPTTLEWVLSCQQEICHHTEGPNVSLGTVSELFVDHFGCHIFRSTDHIFNGCFVSLKERGKSEIEKLHFEGFATWLSLNHDVLELDVSVADTDCMQAS